MGLFPPGPETKGWPERLACLALVATRAALPDAKGTPGHMGAPAEESLGVPPVCKYCGPQPGKLTAQGSLPSLSLPRICKGIVHWQSALLSIHLLFKTLYRK